MDKETFIQLAEQVRELFLSLEGEDLLKALSNKLRPYGLLLDLSFTVLEFGDAVMTTYSPETDEILVAEISEEKVIFRNAPRTYLPLNFGKIPQE
jgi:hypothetical protein